MNKCLYPVIAICFMLGCSTSQQPPPGLLAEQPALHALQDQALRDLMDRMSGLMLERFMTEHEMDIERRKYARQIIDAANTLQTSADALSKRAAVLGMTAEEQNAFLVMTHKLEHQATLLKMQAENNRFNAISGTLHEMKSTCMACHTLFRKI
jgi:hypothetical protein